MADIVDKQTRSRMMAGIRGKNTKPELALRRALHARGLRFRLHSKKIVGRPDIIFPKYRAVVFVHGCFWHVHPDCAARNLRGVHGRNGAFWQEKLARNVLRDRAQLVALAELGWEVLVVWECECRRLAALRSRIQRFLRKDASRAPDAA